jgi:hypothetical protein
MVSSKNDVFRVWGDFALEKAYSHIIITSEVISTCPCTLHDYLITCHFRDNDKRFRKLHQLLQFKISF